MLATLSEVWTHFLPCHVFLKSISPEPQFWSHAICFWPTKMVLKFRSVPSIICFSEDSTFHKTHTHTYIYIYMCHTPPGLLHSLKVGHPYKPSFATVTTYGVDPNPLHAAICGLCSCGLGVATKIVAPPIVASNASGHTVAGVNWPCWWTKSDRAESFSRIQNWTNWKVRDFVTDAVKDILAARKAQAMRRRLALAWNLSRFFVKWKSENDMFSQNPWRRKDTTYCGT